MGAGASGYAAEDLPERMDKETLERLARTAGVDILVNPVRFDMMKDKEGTISRAQALQLLENKMPAILSVNPMGMNPALSESKE